MKSKLDRAIWTYFVPSLVGAITTMLFFKPSFLCKAIRIIFVYSVIFALIGILVADPVNLKIGQFFQNNRRNN